MGRLSPEQRSLVSHFRRIGMNIKLIMQAFKTSRTTIWYWSSQDLRTRFDIIKNSQGKITIEVETAILYYRNTFSYGSARIKQRLISAPSFELEQLEVKIQNFELSRQAIQNVLVKHKINGYKKKYKHWKFFRAKYVNELWQLDLKEFKLNGKKYHLLVLIDDYSRFLLKLYLFDHAPNIPEICNSIKLLTEKYHPMKILTDNNPFKQSWEEWCQEQGIEAVFAHPYYPQDKGKVERSIRNITEELINSFKLFPQWIYRIEEWRVWHNKDRYHHGIKDYPANLFKC